MSKSKNRMPIYDERVKATLKGLTEGKTREELAQGFDLSSWKSLDIYMRRKFFRWDGENGTYVPAENRLDNILEDIESNVPIKAEQIMKKFEEYGEEADPRQIAQEFGFDDHNELADYMSEHNLEFCVEARNYIEGYRKDIDKDTLSISEDNSKISESNTSTSTSTRADAATDNLEDGELAELLGYLPMLRLLEEHKDDLLNSLMVSSEGKIPNYGVPGTPGTKSIYMSILLSRLMADFSKTKNLSQREIVEAAIIEYLERYGYKLEVEKLLSKR